MTKKITAERLQETISKKRAAAEKAKLALQAVQAKYDALNSAVDMAELQLKTRFGSDEPEQPQTEQTEQVTTNETTETTKPEQTEERPDDLKSHPKPIQTSAPPAKRQRKPRAPKVFVNEPVQTTSQQAEVPAPEASAASTVQPVIVNGNLAEQRRRDMEEAVVESHTNPYAAVFQF